MDVRLGVSSFIQWVDILILKQKSILKVNVSKILELKLILVTAL